MRTSRLVSFIAVGAISLPLLAGTVSAVGASPRTTSVLGWKQVTELKGSDTVTGDGVGFSVAISGSTAVVGAYGHTSYAGRAYVFTKTGSGWTQAGELKGLDTVVGDQFGCSVAISGNTVVVGAGARAGHAGRAYVFTDSSTGWKQVVELKGSDTVTGDYFGWSVAISGTTVVVGAYGHDKSAGRTYVFDANGSSWKQVAELKSADRAAGDQFGSSVAISGTTMVVAATGHAKAAGRAYVFTKTASSWKQAAELKGVDTGAGDHFGWSVAISGPTVVVGAFHHASLAGRAYVFTKKASGWAQAAELKGSDTIANDGFGISVAVSGPTAVVGATGHAAGAGRVYMFTKSPTGWSHAGEIKGSDTAPGDEFGFSVAISGSTAIVGAPSHAKQAGRAYVFGA